MKIIIIQKIFPNYRKAIFDKLHQAYGANIVHGKNESGIQQISANYSIPVRLIQFSKKETLVFLFGFRQLLKSRPKIIVHEFTIGILSLSIVRILAYFMGSKFILWGHNINLKRGFKPYSNFADFYRFLLMKSSDAVLFYSPDQLEPVKEFINNKKLFVAYNALDTDTQLANYKLISSKSRELVKHELGINTKYNLIFISRLLPAKKTEQIIEIYRLLDEDIKLNLTVHIIGSGPMYLPLQEMVEEAGFANNIKLYGEITNEITLGKYLYASDFMINPGYLGLSVNLAFAYGCPIITFDNALMDQPHSPEVYYLKDGYSGIIIKNLDVIEMAASLNHSLKTESYIIMRENCLNTIYKEGSIHQMFSGFQNVLSYVDNNFIPVSVR